MRGVFIFGVGLVRWGRMFMEPVDSSATDMSAAVGHLLAGRDA